MLSIIRTIRKFGRPIANKIRFWRRKKYISQLKEMFPPEVSIISSNCFAGRILQDLGREYNTPTLGLYFWAPDYIEFLKNINYYLTEAKIQFVEKSKYELGNERRLSWSHWYPIGLLDGKVEIHFLHYHSEEEAAEKWYRRASRTNLNNLFIIGMDQNQSTKNEIIEFEKLPYQNKIYFSRFPLNKSSNEYMPEFHNKESVGDAYKKAHLYYKHLINHFKINK